MRDWEVDKPPHPMANRTWSRKFYPATGELVWILYYRLDGEDIAGRSSVAPRLLSLEWRKEAAWSLRYLRKRMKRFVTEHEITLNPKDKYATQNDRYA